MAQATFVQDGASIDYTPGSAVAAGDVVVIGERVGIAKRAISASVLGALAVAGVFKIVKTTGAIAQWARVYWDSDGDPDDGTAGSGALSTDPSVGKFAGVAVAAAASGDDTVSVLLNRDPATEALPAAISDPGDAGAIPVNQGDGYVSIVTAGAETRTVPAPAYVGQRILLTLDTDGGDAVVTIAGTVNQTGNNTLTFADVDDAIELVGKSNGKWSVGFNDGVALTTV